MSRRRAGQRRVAGRSGAGRPEHASRLARLRAALRPYRADWILITHPVDVAYLTGFLGGDSYLLVGRGRPVILSDRRYEEELEAFRPWFRVVMRRGPFPAAVASVLPGRVRLGIQAEHMSLAERDALAQAVGHRRLVPTRNLVGRLRMIKDRSELRLIRRAHAIQESALEALRTVLEPGLTELDVAAWLEAAMKRRGSSQPGFNTIVAADASSSLPHYRPGRRRLRQGGIVLIDWGAVCEGYHGDMTRVVALGRWPPLMRELYQIVLEAHERAAAALAPGRTTHEVDGVARRYIEQQGYGDRFGHGLGHGMGLDGHEDPRLNPLYPPVTLEPGHVVTIEPGIYLPGVGGVRIEDTYVVTARGSRRLTRLPRDLRWARLG